MHQYKNNLVVFGGIVKHHHSPEPEIFLLSLDELIWTKMSISPGCQFTACSVPQLSQLSNFSSIISEDDLLIFGGKNAQF
jgi:hypothetical protein